MENVSKADIIVAYKNIPYNIIAKDLKSMSKDSYDNEIAEIEELYRNYDEGADFITEGSQGDYIPSDLKYKKASSIINKEARFMFSNPPDFNVNPDGMDTSEKSKDNNTVIQDFLDRVLKANNFSLNLMKACKDCFIGKRIACVLNFSEDSGITITFLNSLQFIYDLADDGSNRLNKIVTFYNMVDTDLRADQRYFKKTYEMENGFCYATDEVYDGLGTLVETITPRIKTAFDKIPAVVILNDGLIGDFKGKSELNYLVGYEERYSKLANADIDAERKSMNPIRWTVDADPNSTKELSIAPGAFWDIKSDEGMAENHNASVGMMESNMSYSNALKETLDRVENSMFAQVDVPNIDSEKLQGVITSGKTLKALYWGLSVRCDEKMLTWAGALEYLAKMIIEGGKLYPNIAKIYISDKIPTDYYYEIFVENNYPLPEDEQEEKQMDISEITAQAMSRKFYMKKWRKLTDKEADEELRQILMEKQLLEDSYVPTDEELQTDNINNQSDSQSASDVTVELQGGTSENQDNAQEDSSGTDQGNIENNMQ
jgi:hypothetical protein